MPKIVMHIEWEPRVDQIWAEGEWPTKPTAADLIKEIKELAQYDGTNEVMFLMVDGGATVRLTVDGEEVDLEGSPEYDEEMPDWYS